MNFIDISSWQRGLDLSALFRQNPIDGVIVKTSGGASYTQDTADPWIQWLIKNGKPWGFYHFLNDDWKGSSGKAEAEFFVSRCRSYFGKGMPFADYEASALSFGTYYLKAFLDTVYSLTGVKCGVYCSLSVIHEQDFSEIAKAGYPLWVAQYADSAVVNGFLETPWQSGSVSPFPKYVMHQYSGNGRLKGYANALDLDKYYGTKEDWAKMLSNGYSPSPEPTPERKSVNPSVVADILAGRFGTGVERVERLSREGFDPVECQNKVNEVYGIAQSCKKYINGNEDYLNSIIKVVKLL